MSSALYTIRLFWDGRKGCGVFAGKTWELAERPAICGQCNAPWAVDFAPEARTFMRKDRECDAWRDMEGFECVEALAYLTDHETTLPPTQMKDEVPEA